VSIEVIGLAALVPHHIIETKNPPGMSMRGGFGDKSFLYRIAAAIRGARAAPHGSLGG
jgi:hypothetical protein